jgi:hypothetical protein
MLLTENKNGTIFAEDSTNPLGMRILLEHSSIAGTIYNEQFLMYGTTGCILNEMVNINESADVNIKIVRFKGKFQEADAINKNKRMYPFSILDSNMKRLEESVNSGGLCGELDHPTDSIIHFKEAAHKITKLWWEGSTMMGEGIILNTPNGKVLRSLINDGVRIGISSRGVGNGKVNEEGILVIGESYKLITFDAVADPSTYAAFQEKITGKRESVASEPVISNYSQKTETTGIYTINKNILLACVGGIISQTTQDLKARME